VMDGRLLRGRLMVLDSGFSGCRPVMGRGGGGGRGRARSGDGRTLVRVSARERDHRDNRGSGDGCRHGDHAGTHTPAAARCRRRPWRSGGFAGDRRCRCRDRRCRCRDRRCRFGARRYRDGSRGGDPFTGAGVGGSLGRGGGILGGWRVRRRGNRVWRRRRCRVGGTLLVAEGEARDARERALGAA
jgi:hypothetical protein